MSKVVFAIAMVALILSAAACSDSKAGSSTTISLSTSPTSGTQYSSNQSSTTADDADARLPTPAGVVVYKGNVNGANLVPMVNLSFNTGNDTISFNYRAEIETNSGTTRNEIISIYDSANQVRYNQIGPNSNVGDVTLTVDGLPSGITSELDTPGFDFHISNDVKPGKYIFQIVVTFDGGSFTLPCTITVL